ncbi:MAG: CHRD domain-containing protein [Thermoproteota archaeon]|nr:CHRD domain-containing protein [Thermoproteota archaeon]
MNPKNNTLKILSAVGFSAAILILGASTDGSIGSSSAQQQQNGSIGSSSAQQQQNGSIGSSSAQQQQQFAAKLSGSNEVPAVTTSATGTAKFSVGSGGKSLNYVLNVTNMNGVTGAHIHSGKQGENGPVVAGLFNSGMVGPPTGKENGVLAKGNITSSDLQGTMPGKQISDLVNLMKSHGAYVSINTQQHQNGEIRGQVG